MRTHTHGHMENINIITNSKQQVMGAATQPQVIQSQHPLTHSPNVIGLGGRIGTATLLATDDNWLINVQPMASESKSTGFQPRDHTGLMKLRSHLDNGAGPQRPTQGVCVCVCSTGRGLCKSNQFQNIFSPICLLLDSGSLHLMWVVVFFDNR